MAGNQSLHTMYEQPSRKKTYLLIAISVIVALAISVFFIIAYLNNDVANNSAGARQHIKQRRDAVGVIMTALKDYADNNTGNYPTTAQVNDAVREQLGYTPVEPTTQEPLTLQANQPNAPTEIQYATQATCTSNLYAIQRTSSSRDIALLIQDDLIGYFCLSSRVHNP